jgi:hypothetical protein
MVDALVNATILTPGAAAALFMHVLFDRELQRLLYDNAVEEVEVGPVLRFADRNVKFFGALLHGRASVKEERNALLFRNVPSYLL